MTIVVEKIKPHTFSSITPPPENVLRYTYTACLVAFVEPNDMILAHK